MTKKNALRRHKRKIARFAALLALALSGCADMTPREKYWTGVAVGVVAAGAIAAHQEHGTPQTDPVIRKTDK